MIVKPISDNIVLKLPKIERTETTKSGIVLVKEGTQQSLRTDIASVVAVGEGRMLNSGALIPCSVKAGDRVLFNKFAGTEVVSGEEKYLIVKECDILAIIEE